MPAAETEASTGPAPLKGLLLAGGRSRRLGQDKALLESRGQVLLHRSYELLNALCLETFVAIGPDHRDEPTRRALPTLVDRVRDAGPLGAIATAAHHDANAAWLVLAVDMPAIDTSDLERLLAVRSPGIDVICFRAGDQPEPLAAVWEPAATRHASEAFADGARSPIRLLGQLRTKHVTLPLARLASINRPEDLTLLKR